MAHSSEAGHFYDAKTGEPVYEVPNKSKPGTMRPATLRDARNPERPLVASVTTIMQVLAKPALINWKIRQAILASLTYPRPAEMGEDDWISAIIDDAERQAKEAADLGTRIHAAIQGAYEGELWSPDLQEFCYHTLMAVEKEFGKRTWIPEKSFAHPLGYGGKVDIQDEQGLIVADFKSTSLNGDKLKKAGYDEHILQLAAYRLGLGLERATLANIYISTTVPGEVFIKLWSDEDAMNATKQWLALLAFWKEWKNFKSGE